MTSNNGSSDAAHVSTSEAGRALGVSRWTVRRMIEDEELDAIDVRGRVKVDRASVERYISEHHHGRGN